MTYRIYGSSLKGNRMEHYDRKEYKTRKEAIMALQEHKALYDKGVKKGYFKEGKFEIRPSGGNRKTTHHTPSFGFDVFGHHKKRGKSLFDW